MNGRKNEDCSRITFMIILMLLMIFSGFSCSHVRKIERTPEHIEKLKKELANKRQTIEFVDGTKKTVKDIEIDSDSVRWVNIQYKRGITNNRFQVLDNQADLMANVKAISYVDGKQGLHDEVQFFAVMGTLLGRAFYLYVFQESNFSKDAAAMIFSTSVGAAAGAAFGVIVPCGANVGSPVTYELYEPGSLVLPKITNKLEPWYFYWGFGTVRNTHPEELNETLKYLRKDYYVRHSIEPGVYYRLNNRTLLGINLNLMEEYSAIEGPNEEISLISTLFALSAYHFFPKRIGQGLFLKGDFGVSGFWVNSYKKEEDVSDWGFGGSIGAGIGLPINNETRLLFALNYSLRNHTLWEGKNNKITIFSFTAGLLF